MEGIAGGAQTIEILGPLKVSETPGSLSLKSKEAVGAIDDDDVVLVLLWGSEADVDFTGDTLKQQR